MPKQWLIPTAMVMIMSASYSSSRPQRSLAIFWIARLAVQSVYSPAQDMVFVNMVLVKKCVGRELALEFKRMFWYN